MSRDNGRTHCHGAEPMLRVNTGDGSVAFACRVCGRSGRPTPFALELNQRTRERYAAIEWEVAVAKHKDH